MTTPLPLDARPFCKGDAEIERMGTPRQSTIYSCTECGCRLETGEEWGHGRIWNERAAPDGLTNSDEHELRAVTSGLRTLRVRLAKQLRRDERGGYTPRAGATNMHELRMATVDKLLARLDKDAP